MNSGKEIQRSDRQSSRTEFFVPHFDRSYDLTLNQTKNAIDWGISNESPNMSINLVDDKTEASG